MNDLRSQVAKESCGLVVFFAQHFAHEFSQNYKENNLSVGGNGVRYFKDDALYKLIASGNKTL